MKKMYLTAALAAAALSLTITACSGNSAETAAPSETAQTTEAEAAETAQEAAAPAGTAEEAVEEAEEDYYYGFVTEAADGVITVTDDEGGTARFDISEAAIEGAATEAGTGDEVEITFEGALSEDVTKAKVVDIMTSAAGVAEEEAEAESDEVLTGTIEAADDKTVTLKTEDGTYTFNSIIAQKVTKDGIKAGAEADITYYGDPEDTEDPAVATRIITADARDTEEAQESTLTGTVADAGSDYVVLDTADPANTLFSFVGTEGMFDGVAAGETVTVVYRGTLTARSIEAVGIK